MDKPAFTPGPWVAEEDVEIEQGEPVGRWFNIVGSDGLCVVSASGLGGSTEAEIGNARLIAAAPELYEALTWTLAEIEGRTAYQDAHQRARCLARVQAVIAKAEGRA